MLDITSNFEKWTSGIVPLACNPSDAPVGYQDDMAVRDLIEESLSEWTGACNLTFVRADMDDDGIDTDIDSDKVPDLTASPTLPLHR